MPSGRRNVTPSATGQMPVDPVYPPSTGEMPMDRMSSRDEMIKGLTQLTQSGAGMVYGFGDEGEEVERIQQMVGAKVDGIWGPETERRVRAFQEAIGVAADGLWGPKTEAAAQQLMADKYTPEPSFGPTRTPGAPFLDPRRSVSGMMPNRRMMPTPRQRPGYTG